MGYFSLFAECLLKGPPSLHCGVLKMSKNPDKKLGYFRFFFQLCVSGLAKARR